MIKCFKTLFLIVVFPLLTLLTGCNSEGAFNSESQPPVDAVVFDITVTPSPISVLINRTQQLVAMAKFDDGTESDVAGSATWTIVGNPEIATVSASGLVTGISKGNTELTASKGGITSKTVNVNVCDNLAEACIDIFDTGNGKLFTNSPSKAYLDSIGGSANDTYAYKEDGKSGPVGVFYRFTWSDAETLCDMYNDHSLGGRKNWRLATKDELKEELFDVYINMFTEREWPAFYAYWTATLNPNPDPYADGSRYFTVHLIDERIISYDPSAWYYVSCVSNP
ncbi:Ig-like domain-containing protein [Vibrio cincinnatiensis]|uniref:Ig-like domain-containing protein n=1 Tax=Vibrio cincinnatiensis TaxID=675 RepID=UPI001EDE3E36|nr:Ig-like domain-containing protein [Vibrio cincinnatiensis]MCG3728913.1 DUF1566 domain-containing protein [Vibrio cincinnatiensis]